MQDELKPREQMIRLVETTQDQAAQVREALKIKENSDDPETAAEAHSLLIRLRNIEQDLRVRKAFLKAAAEGEVKPVPAGEARELDELGAALDKNTQAMAVGNATLLALGQAVNTINRVGQILDERPKPQVRTATSGPRGTSTRSS